MSVIVQKFGGSSLTKPEQREMAARRVVAAVRAGYTPVVVVSAMGRSGDPYATDSLIQLCRAEHPDPIARSLDMVMACGEIISAVVFSGVLRRLGYEAVPLSGGQAGLFTDEVYGHAAVQHVLPERLQVLTAQGRIPVVAGFQGISANGDWTTLGRGGSDTTAALLGEALESSCVEIYTDVDGIMTADPRLVPHARVLRHIGYGEVFQIADQGAKVIHTGAVAVSQRSGIPLVIRNTANDLPGTIISDRGTGEEHRTVSSITYLPGRCQVNVQADTCTRQHLLEGLAENGVSIDLINIFPDRMLFTVGDADADKVEALCGDGNVQVALLAECAKISAVGEAMRGVPGVMVRILRALESAQVEVLQSVDSLSTISCLVRGQETTASVLALHEAFGLSGS